MKKINHKILMPVVFCLVMVSVYFLNREKPEEAPQKELKFNERVEEKDILKAAEGVDINLATVEEMREAGLSKSVSEKIAEYRDMTGTIRDFSELKRIKGFGGKTLEKVRELLTLDESGVGEKLKLNINKASEEELMFYGFTKKELGKINRWKDTKGDIFSNIDLISIVGERRYDELKNDIIY